MHFLSEAVDWLNEHAAEDARVAVYEPLDVAVSFARPDLHLEEYSPHDKVDYLLQCNHRSVVTADDLDELPVDYAVMRSGVVLSLVRRPDRRSMILGTVGEPSPGSCR